MTALTTRLEGREDVDAVARQQLLLHATDSCNATASCNATTSHTRSPLATHDPLDPLDDVRLTVDSVA